MDNSRDHDLKALNERMNDVSLPKSARTRAWRTFNSILAQVSDKVLVELRHRLIRARAANDDLVGEKLERQIDEHVARHHY